MKISILSYPLFTISISCFRARITRTIYTITNLANRWFLHLL